MKVPFIWTAPLYDPVSPPKQHLCKTMHHMRRNIFTERKTSTKKTIYLLRKVLWPCPAQNISQGKSHQCQQERCKTMHHTAGMQNLCCKKLLHHLYMALWCIPPKTHHPKLLNVSSVQAKRWLPCIKYFNIKQLACKDCSWQKNYTHLFDLKLHSAKWSLQDLKLQTEMYVKVCTNGLGRFQQKYREIWGH